MLDGYLTGISGQKPLDTYHLRICLTTCLKITLVFMCELHSLLDEHFSVYVDSQFLEDWCYPLPIWDFLIWSWYHLELLPGFFDYSWPILKGLGECGINHGIRTYSKDIYLGGSYGRSLFQTILSVGNVWTSSVMEMGLWSGSPECFIPEHPLPSQLRRMNQSSS